MSNIYIVLDTETTGFDCPRGDTLTQFAAVAVDDDAKQILKGGFFQIKLPPEKISRLTQEAIDVQGWTKEANDSGRPLEDCLRDFRAWVDTVAHVGYVSHNARFDRSFCVHLGFVDENRPWFCTWQGMKLAQDRRLIKCERHKLANLAELVGFQFGHQHCAWDDTLACANGWLYLRRLGLSPQDMQHNTFRRAT